jgi:hypothetical protein
MVHLVAEPKHTRSAACPETSPSVGARATKLHLEAAIETDADSTFRTMPISTDYSSAPNVAGFSQTWV